MRGAHAWNHNNFAVPPERFELVESCIDALFPWTKFVAKPHLLGYRLGEDLHHAAIYFRPVEHASVLDKAIRALRIENPEIDGAIRGLETIDADYNDHCGFIVPTVTEWEERVAIATRLSDERPEFQIRVVAAFRPGDGRALTDYLYQAFIRVGILGPVRNTFEMQAMKV